MRCKTRPRLPACLLTEAMVTEKPEPKPAMPPGGGMGGMGIGGILLLILVLYLIFGRHGV